MPNIDLTPSTEVERNAKSMAEKAAAWHKELANAYKREKTWRKEALTYTQLYEAGKRQENQYNILYANTEVLGPAVYNSTPRPVVERRFKDEDPLGKMASQAAQRMLEYMVDNGQPQESTFDELLKSAVLEGLVPGRGVTRFRYDAEIETKEAEAAELPEAEPASEAGEPAAQSRVRSEYVCGEEVPWNRFRHGYAKKWKDVPWVAFEHDFDKEELVEAFGAAIASQIPLTESDADSDDNGDDSDADGSTQERSNVSLAKVFEIWDKSSKSVIFVTPNNVRLVLKEVPDPFQLAGFFPCPRPLTFVQKISSLVPVPPFALYEEQAKELNRVTTRINKLLAMLKVRGMYDSQVQGIDKVLSGEDGVLIPAENVAALLGQGNSLEKALWLMPIDKIIAVLQQLYQVRPQIKAVIFEISGIADIMRGSSTASETLGAQKIKESWGTLRLKRAQKEVARYARDCLRLMTELGVSKLAPQTLQGMTGLPYPTQGQKQQMVAQLQNAQAMGQQIPPDAVVQLQTPTWEDLLALLRDDVQRSFRIDIETNSTVDAEATEDKQNIAELLNAISQFLSGVAPLIESGSMPFEVAKTMLLAITRRFRFGPEFEDSLKKMQQPPQKPDPAAAKAQADMQNNQQLHQLDMQKAQMDLQARQQEMAGKQREAELKAQLEMQKMQMELQMAEREHQLKMEEMGRKSAVAAQAHSMKLQQMAAQAAMPKPAGSKAG
jgi:hypothetical protein